MLKDSFNRALCIVNINDVDLIDIEISVLIEHYVLLIFLNYLNSLIEKQF